VVFPSLRPLRKVFRGRGGPAPSNGALAAQSAGTAVTDDADPARLYKQRPAAQHKPAPLEADVTYAVELAHYYPPRLQELGVKLDGAQILELGPGKNLGLALIFTGYGARVTVADRFPCPWDEDYHRQFYALMKERWEGPQSGIEAALATGGYSAITMLDTDDGGLAALVSATFDAVISHAVLEHIVDVEGTCHELARVTRPGGVHIHQIDYRDHRDQTRPLDHLLIPEAEFMAKLASVHWNTGNRYRHNEFCTLFDAVGFDLIDTLIDPETERPLASYLPCFIPQLRASQSHYRDWPEEKLGPLGARLTLRKRASMGLC
jgi:SAM-dependent methyltransferase